ncbi:hypothetical protein GN958_ATG08467 [Phytophthora infestans]|uniref:Uncharacterized protein n=1 Tax=Phytophthora infestans TaxID=4787 RepID=A0A8S9UN99_PHYIN|nr:hypothetical protein GN958_ATG08467 [Phytophthora infestans]
MAEEARMSVELRESVQRTYDKSIQMRPANTQRAYTKRQKAFRDWCAAKGSAFSDLTRCTVTGENFISFLRSVSSEERSDAKILKIKTGHAKQ